MVAEAEAIPERNNRSLHIQSYLGKEGTRTGIRADSNRNGAWSSVDDNHHTIERRSLLVRNSFCRTQCGSPSWRRGGRGSIGPAGKRRNARTNCFWLTNSRGLLIIAGVAAGRLKVTLTELVCCSAPRQNQAVYASGSQCLALAYRPVRLVVRDAMSWTGLCLYLILMLLASYVE
jgi:hypothetical protein